MKKIGVLNKDISEVVAGMGHMDILVIGDAGLPIPPGVRRIDLALRAGLPGFLETVDCVAGELKVERIIVASETYQSSPKIVEGLKKIFPGTDCEEVSHEELKKLSSNAVAVIRTGEFTPYANVLLVSGVIF